MYGKKQVNDIFESAFFLLLLIVFVIIFVPIGLSFEKDKVVSLLFLIIGILSIIGMVNSVYHRSFSIRFIFWFFCFSFLFCAGVTQFANGHFCWEFSPSLEEVETANIYIIVFMLVFSFSAIKVFPAKKIRLRVSENRKEQAIVFHGMLFVFLEIVLFLMGSSAIFNNGFEIMFSRELFGVKNFSSFIDNSSLRSLLSSIINATCMFCVILAMIQLKKTKSKLNVVCALLAWIVLLINVPPLAVPRFTVAGIYGGIMLYISDWLKKGKRFIYFLIFGLLIIFPMLNAFRYEQSNVAYLEAVKSSLGGISENFTKADYDSYTMIVYSVRYVQKCGITFGRQLLSAILFFIPRKIWTGKSDGSGSMIIGELAPSYIDPNVSCPFIAEGLLNFGIVGICLFSFVLGKLTKTLDTLYWEKWNKNDNVGNLLYCYFILFSLLLFRGDLMSSTAFLTGMIVVTLLLSKFFRRKYQ